MDSRSFHRGLCLLLWAWAGATAALQPDIAPSQYAQRSWDRSGGLPNDAVYAIAQTPDGYLWLGTEGGLVRFDGHRYVLYDKRNTPALGKNFVRALCTDANGTLWIGGLDGVLSYRNETIRRAPALPGASHPSVMALLCAPDGAVYAGGAGGSVQRIDAAGASELPGWHQQTTKAITALAWSAQHRLLIGSHGDGLFECAAAKCSQRFDAEDLPGGKVTALLADASGETLIGLYAGGVYSLIGDALVRPDFAAALPPGQIWSMLRDRENNLWVAVQEGSLLRVNAQGTARLVRRDDTVSIFPRVLFESAERNLWVGSIGSGLLRLSNPRVLTIGVSEGLSEDMVWSVLEDAHGSIWIGTDGGGVNRLADGAVTHWTIPDQPLANVVTAAALGAAGEVWLGTRAGVLISEHGEAPQLDRRPGAPTDLVPALFVDSQHRLWSGSSGTQVKVLEDGVWRAIDAGFTGDSAWAFAEDAQGGIWVATASSGAYRYRQGRWTRFTAEQGLTTPSVNGIFVDSGGAVWLLGLESGLFRVVDDHVMALGARAGLSDDDLYAMLEDDAGNFWLSSSVGLFRVAKSALDQVLVQPGFVAQATHFGASDGMRSENCNGTVQPAAWKRRDGSLWFATTRGVVRIDPSRLGQQPSSPRVLIESVRVDGRTIDRSHPGILDAATRRVDVAFTALGLHTPERAAFRYKLEGLDADWQDATGKRELEFTGLRAGKYRLVVGLAARDGEWLPAQVEYVFAVAAPFTETPRFYLLLVAGVALCGFAWHRYRLALLNARTARLQERAHIARELHDTIAQGFSGILVRLEVAARMTPEPDAATRERLAGVQAIARESMQSLRAAVAVMQPEGRIGANLDRVLREQIERQLQDTDLVWTFVCEGAPRDFGPVASHHLCRITQEAISNVLMHAAAANVDIRLSYSAEGLCLTIADDGRGLREPVARTLASGGSGIIGMRARMEEIGGLFEILDGGKGGCIVRITLAPNRGRVRAEGG